MEDQRRIQTPTYSDFSAASSTPRAKGDWNAASSLDHCGTEEEHFDDDDIDELIDSGPNSESEHVRENSTSSDSNHSPDTSGAFVQKPGAASCSLQDNMAPLSSSEPESEDDIRPRRASREPRYASYSTKSYCFFCSAGTVKMARHLLRHIGEDSDLAKAFSLPKNSKERRRILDHFRIKGNYRHNREVLKYNCGELKLRRKPKSKGAVSVLHCPYCKGMFVRKEMWRHVKKCLSRETPKASTGGRKKALGEAALAESPSAQNLPSAVWKLLTYMKQDCVAFAVRNDLLLLKLAEHLFYKDRIRRQFKAVRVRIREMGRLLIALRKKSITSFQDAVKPANFYTVLKGVKRLAGYSAKRRSYTKPSLALRLGHSLRVIGTIVLQRENNDEQTKRDARMFIKLCNEEWTQLVSQSDFASLQGQQSTKPSTIRFTWDVQLFYRYLESASASAVNNLKATEGQDVYAALCRVTLAKVSALNKCAAEVSKMTLKAFQDREDAAQVLSRHFIRINVENREGQSVTVLLTSDLVSAMTLLVSKRDACGVHKDNPFLFARPNSSPTSVYCRKQSVKVFSILCRAENPEHLLAARRHKHIARVFQILTLENDELQHLAKLLGHNFRADKDFYRLPEAAVDLAKIAKLILAMEKGCLDKSQGKSLEEVEIEDELEPDEEQLSPEISDAEEGDGDLQERDAVKQKAMAEKERLEEREEGPPTPGEDVPEVEDSGGSSSSADSCSEDEYIPDGGASSDESYSGNETQRASKHKSSSVKRSFNEESSDEDESYSSSDKEPKRRPSSINYCFVCGKAQTKVSRHLFTHRNDDPEIAEVFKLRKNSKERCKRLNELRERGNSKHNETVLNTGCGELKVKPKKLIMPPATKACLFCKDLFTCKDMRKHVPKCSVRKSTETPNCKNKVLFLVASADLTDNSEASSELSGLIKSMKQDEISAAVLNDSLLLRMARYIWLLNVSKVKKKAGLVQKLRAIGKLLLTLKKSSISSLEDVMKPENFRKVREAVLELSDFNEERKFCGKQSLMLTFQNTLKYIADINYARALKEGGDKQRIEEAQAFVRLCLNEWGGLYKTKPTPTVPFIHDAQLLFQCMQKTTESALESLTKYECAPVYCALSRVTAAHLLLLNQNVDVFELPLKSFQEREEAEAAVSQSQLEQILSTQLMKISAMSNKGKQVTVTLTPALLAALELLVSKREACGVSSDSLFLFAQPGAKGTNLFTGTRCFNMITSRCDAVNKVSLRSLFFRKHLTRVFQVLSLTNDQLHQLAKLLGREIQTDGGYYQKPEAAPDIARLLELLSAVETETLERFEGRSFEEIEFADELEPHSEPVNPENSDTEGDDDESESSFQRKASAKGSSSSRKKTPGSSSRKRSSKRPVKGRRRARGTDRRQESEDEASEPEDEEREEANTQRDDRSEERPESADGKTPQGTPPCRKEDTTNMSYSDNDDDMNVDFDSDEDIPRNEGTNADDGAHESEAVPLLPTENDVREKEEARREDTEEVGAAEEMDTDPEDHTVEDQEEGGGEEQSVTMDVGSRSPSPLSDEEKLRKISAAMIGTTRARIVIPKLDLGKLKAPILLSQLSPAVTSGDTDQPVSADNKRCQKSPKSTDAGVEKEIQMICSHCKKVMLKGQTAYQKKGFTDVFCSKDCLFKMFPVNKPASRPCFNCSKAITNLSDLIMAAVDVKGTMKDFCSMTCLCCFKSNSGPSQTQQPVCSMCKKSGPTKCGLMLKDVFYNFCSEKCFEGFCAVNLAVCAKCKSTCYKPLKLKLQNEPKSLCSQDCLDDFTKEIQRPHPCTMCRVFHPVSDMVIEDMGENMMELFCARACLISYQLRPANHKEMKESAHLRRKNRDKQPAQVEVKTASDSLVTNAPPDIETSDAPTVLIGDLMFCTVCGKRLPSGAEVCPRSCVVAKNQHRKCFSCNEEISRPHSVILVPVDDNGTTRELCSNKCLASLNAKRSQTRCKMCNTSCFSSGRLTLDDLRHTVCSDACLIKYHRDINLPLVTCDVCSFSSLKQLTLRTEDGDKSVCGDKCLVRIKESMKKPQQCPMCQMLHQISDMVEDENNEGVLDFFCSNRCMLVHKAQSVTVSGRENSLVSKEEEEEEEVKEEQILPSIDSIKQEPVEEECKPNLPSFLSPENIKEEPTVAKDDLKTEEASSPRDATSTEPTEPTAPTATSTDVPPSCSNCKNFLMDGETAYQKKSHSEIFCSSPCLLNFFQTKEDKTSCTFCLQTITRRTRMVHQAPVDDEGTMKDFCSQTCMFSFNYKRMMTTKVSIVPVASHSPCHMCNRYCISKHEIIKDAVIHKICSDPCLMRFCNLNKLSICVNCYSHLETPLTVSMEDCCKQMCSAECLAAYKQKVQTPQPCAMCSTSLQMSDMVESKNSEGEVELFCNNDCVVASKIQAVSSSGAHVNCDQCGKNTEPACHFTMSDASIRSFCTQSCATAFKEANKNKTVSIKAAEASDQTQTESLEPPKQLFCAQCRRIMKTPPKVIQEKDKVSFVCSPSCSEDFMRVNNISRKCERCKKRKSIKIIKRVDKRVCFFCSEGCKMLFHEDLKKQWGDHHCQSCAYCLSISQMLVKERYGRTVERFCSNNCRLRYSLLQRDLSVCDSCGVQGRLSQSLSLIGEVKYFCDMMCVQHFCNRMQTTDSPPQPVSTAESSPVITAESSPVITNVISLAGALAKRKSSTCGSNTQISYTPLYFQTTVVGHAGVQTDPKELKNKSTLCTPLVHNKGVSCATQTVDTGSQTENSEPRDRVLPVPVPVYVPLPLNMYSQFTPSPVGLPIPLPVPVFLPGKPERLHETVEPTQKEIQPDSFREELDLKSETKKVRHEKNVQTREGREQETLDPPERQRERACPSALETTEDQRSSAPAPSSQTQPAEKVHNKNKGRKLQPSSNEAKEETRHGASSKAVLKGLGRVESQCGVEAWKRWIQWRKTLKNAAKFTEEILLCTAAELSDGLSVFIKELRQQDGETHPPDRLFYLCLCIQQYLFENGRMENIFSDSVYAKFSSEFTRILRGFKPSLTASGYIHFHVEEEFLWECKQLGAYSPVVLLNTMLFFCCKSLGFTTVEQHRRLSFTHIVRRRKTNSSNTKSRFLLFYLPKSTTEAESGEDVAPAQKRKKTDGVTMMMENAANPLRCPVRLYEFYLSKCSESVRRQPDLFYLQPDRSCVPSSSVWFSCSPLDDSTMEAMLVRILAIRQMWDDDGEGSDPETAGEKTLPTPKRRTQAEDGQ